MLTKIEWLLGDEVYQSSYIDTDDGLNAAWVDQYKEDTEGHFNPHVSLRITRFEQVGGIEVVKPVNPDKEVS